MQTKVRSVAWLIENSHVFPIGGAEILKLKSLWRLHLGNLKPTVSKWWLIFFLFLLSHRPCSSLLLSAIMTGSYNNFFRMFDRNTRRDITLEASRENSKPRAMLKPRKVCTGGKRKKDEISVDSLDFNKKILHTAWHPKENVIAVAATNNLYIFQDKMN